MGWIMAIEEQLYGLMAAAGEQQKAVDAAIKGLATEKAAMAAARVALEAAVVEVKRSATNASAQLKKAASEAVSTAVEQSLSGASETAAEAMASATAPVIGKLTDVVNAASEAEGSLRNAGAWFAWKWVAVAAGGLAGVCLVAYVSLAWQLHEVSSLRDDQAALNADITQMQANADALAKKGRRIVIDQCGGRPCIEASSNQGADQDGTAIPLGGWHTTDGRNVALVIPRGY